MAVESLRSGGNNCPHCGAPVPTEAGPIDVGADSGGESGVRFCPSCGRRIEGWRPGARATLGGAAAGAVLPGGEEPTRAIAPSPTLLQAAVASKQTSPVDASPVDASLVGASLGDAPPKGASTSLPAVRPSKLPLVLGLVGVTGAVAVLWLMRGRPEAPVVPAPVVTAPTPAVEAPVSPPANKKNGKARRISAPPIASTQLEAGKPTEKGARPEPKNDPLVPSGTKISATKPTKPEAKAGGLPHKDPKKQDSKSTDTGAAPSGTGSPGGELPMAANETVENEAQPMNEAERRAENAARADADGVRFVVRSHLPQVQACYSRAFKESSPGGRVDIGFVINANGKATKVHTEGNTSGAPGLAKCLEQRIAEWDFPRPSSGVFELIYPFVFSPGS